MIDYGKKIVGAIAVALPLMGHAETDVPTDETYNNPQETIAKVDASIATSVVTSYIWRGQRNAGPSIQPSASIGYKGLSLSAWGSYAIAPKTKFEGTQDELDLTLCYSAKGFTVGITDYYFFDAGHPFFKYGGIGKTSHTFEANVGYDFGFLAVNWYTNFAGNDGVNGGGDRAYSSYLQVDAPFKLAHLNWNATLGVVPYRTSFYAADVSNGFHVNQVALRAEYPFELKKVELPVFAQLIANPSSRDMYYVFGFSVGIK